MPIVVLVHGEGGSGGALGIAVGDEILMHENAIYSVISPESCSSILWRDWDHKQEAARVLKMTAEDLYGLKIVDQIVPEPPGGAHMDHAQAAGILRPVLRNCLDRLGKCCARSPEAPPGKASPPGELCQRDVINRVSNGIG